MRHFGIRKGSIIVADKSVTEKGGMLVVCCVDGERLTRKLCFRDNSQFLFIKDNFGAYLSITGRQATILCAVTWICLPQGR